MDFLNFDCISYYYTAWKDWLYIMSKQGIPKCRVCNNDATKEFFPYCSKECQQKDLKRYKDSVASFSPSQKKLDIYNLPKHLVCPSCNQMPTLDYYPYCSKKCADNDLNRECINNDMNRYQGNSVSFSHNRNHK